MRVWLRRRARKEATDRELYEELYLPFVASERRVVNVKPPLSTKPTRKDVQA